MSFPFERMAFEDGAAAAIDWIENGVIRLGECENMAFDETWPKRRQIWGY
ncbi:hypothetical protein [Achromobacter marplatensis]